MSFVFVVDTLSRDRLALGYLSRHCEALDPFVERLDVLRIVLSSSI